MKWPKLLILTLLTILMLNGCNLLRKSPTYVNADKKVILLQKNDAAPVDGVLLSRGYYLELLDYRDKVLMDD